MRDMLASKYYIEKLWLYTEHVFLGAVPLNLHNGALQTSNLSVVCLQRSPNELHKTQSDFGEDFFRRKLPF